MQLDNAKCLNVYNVIEYSDNYSKTSGSLQPYCRNELNAAIVDSFKYVSLSNSRQEIQEKPP